MNIQDLIPPPSELSFSDPISKKGRWIYTDKEIIYALNPPANSGGKKFEKSLQKIKSVLKEINPFSLDERAIYSLEKLRDLINLKVEKYNQVHGKIYKFISRLIYGDINEYKKKTVDYIDELLNMKKSPVLNLEVKKNDSQLNTELEMHQFIPHFVKNFLLPYVTGKITAENESETRNSMMNLLINELEKKRPLSANERKKIEKIALQNYIHVAIQGFYAYFYPSLNLINKHLPGFPPLNDRTHPITANDNAFDFLMSSLVPAVEKDFPESPLTVQDLRALTEKELSKINADTANDVKQDVLQEKKQRFYFLKEKYQNAEKEHLVIEACYKDNLRIYEQAKELDLKNIKEYEELFSKAAERYQESMEKLQKLENELQNLKIEQSRLPRSQTGRVEENEKMKKIIDEKLERLDKQYNENSQALKILEQTIEFEQNPTYQNLLKVQKELTQKINTLKENKKIFFG